MRLPIEHVDARVAEDLGYLAFLAGLVIVVAEDGHDGYGHGGQCLRHQSRLFGITPVREVSAEGKDVSVLGNLAEQNLQRGVGSLAAQMDIADRCDAHGACFLGHRVPISPRLLLSR
jgi:hypothetical protein